MRSRSSFSPAASEALHKQHKATLVSTQRQQAQCWIRRRGTPHGNTEKGGAGTQVVRGCFSLTGERLNRARIQEGDDDGFRFLRRYLCTPHEGRDADGQRAELGGATQPDGQAVQPNRRVRHPMRGHAQPEAAPGTSCGPLSTPAGFLNRQVPGTSYRILARLLANHANTKKYELY